MAVIKKKAFAGRKHPEQQIVTMANSASDYVVANQKVVSIVLAVIAVAALVYGGLTLKRSSDEQKAGPLFAAAYDAYSMQAGVSPDYARALALFQEVRTKYPSSRSGAMAQYYTANTLMDMGRLDEAQKEYQAFTNEYGRDKLLLGLVYVRMGYLYRTLGKDQDAISSFSRAESLNGTGMATLELARLYESAGNEQEAQKRYKVLSEKMAGTPLGMEAAAKMRTAGAPGPGPAAKGGQEGKGK